MAKDQVLDKLEGAFLKNRARLLATERGRWALFVQPNDGRRKPEYVGCFDDEQQACDAGFCNSVGKRFLVQEVVENERVVSVPQAVLADDR